jgi:exonuclease III
VFNNFYLQLFTFVLLACGDIELNPGPTTENVLGILHLNIRSISHKLGHLNSFVHDFDILCFTETHLDNCVSNTNLSLDGFNNIIRKDRNCFGGGVMIYMSNQIRATRRSEFEPADLECIWIEIDNILVQTFMEFR